MAHEFLWKALTSALRAFSWRFLPYHAVAIVLTILCVVLGFDWWYYTLTRVAVVWNLLIPSAGLGFFLPLLLPLIVWGLGHVRGSVRLKHMALLIAEAELAAWLVSAGYKSLTGRIHPELALLITKGDSSSIFHFGFFREGIFWGWPSSHTAVAFAGAVVVRALYPKSWWASVALVYASYIGIGVSATIHWFSDFVAGALIGTAVGRSVIESTHRTNTKAP